jgi:hypothetical protein
LDFPQINAVPTVLNGENDQKDALILMKKTAIDGLDNFFELSVQYLSPHLSPANEPALAEFN